MQGRLHKTAAGYNSYDILDGKEEFIFRLAEILTEKYGFTMQAKPVYGLDGVYWDAQKALVKLTIGWDIWSGIFIFSRSLEGDEYVLLVKDELSKLGLCTHS